MKFSERIVISNLLQRIESRKQQIYRAYDDVYYNMYQSYPDWNYGAEIAADATIKMLYSQVETAIAKHV